MAETDKTERTVEPRKAMTIDEVYEKVERNETDNGAHASVDLALKRMRERAAQMK